jgi:hypothetical protein
MWRSRMGRGFWMLEDVRSELQPARWLKPQRSKTKRKREKPLPLYGSHASTMSSFPRSSLSL